MLKTIPLARPHIDEVDKKAVLDVLNSHQLSSGPVCPNFERKFSSFLSIPYACAVANGTCGLHLAVRALGLGEGDEVITSPFSFVASANCLLYERVKPIFVDIEEETFALDPGKIESRITKKTKAILPIHIFGQSAQMDTIMDIAKKYHLKVIEDACESLGATFQNQMTGTFGDVGVFAFYPNKQITTAEGGMIVTRKRAVYDLCVSMRNQGRNADGDWFFHKRLGYNYRLSELHAALGISQLNKVDLFIRHRRKIAQWYNKHLSSIPGIILPSIAKERTHTWFVYVIRVLNNKRNALMLKLKKIGIQTKPYLSVIHLQPFYREMFGYKRGDFPIAEKMSTQTLALPMFVGLTEKDIKFIAKKISQAIHEN